MFICLSSLPQAPIKHLEHNKRRNWQPFKGMVPDCTRVQLQNEWASRTSEGAGKLKKQDALQPPCKASAHGPHWILNCKELLTCHEILLCVFQNLFWWLFHHLYQYYSTLWLFSNNSGLIPIIKSCREKKATLLSSERWLPLFFFSSSVTLLVLAMYSSFNSSWYLEVKTISYSQSTYVCTCMCICVNSVFPRLKHNHTIIYWQT